MLVRWVEVYLLCSGLWAHLVASGSENGRDDFVVRTDKGKIRGKRYFVPHVGKMVKAYLGIPFAQPPIKDLRFKHPVPVDEWTGIKNTSELPNSCYQNPDTEFDADFYGSNMWNSPTPVSEDCLYLNVWVPKVHPRLRKAAVMVWIFGGGFYSGTTTLGLYDGKILAAEQDVIVVSIGYRVGALGFLALDHPDIPGNAGMFDQLMGLEWVRRNIRHFGGDPHNVTLFGESAGAVSVSLHLLSPLSRDLFQRAIMQSGAPTVPWGVYTMEEGKNRALMLAEELRCPETTNLDVIVKCLQDIKVQHLVDRQWISRGITQFPFVPVIDGCFLIEPPELSLNRSHFKRCPILLGSNANEASFFIIYELRQYLDLNKTSMNRQEFLTSMELLYLNYPQWPQTINSVTRDAIAFQYSNWLDPDNKYKNIAQLDNAVSESQFLCSVNHLAHVYARAGENVFYYYFTERYKSNPWPWWMGVLHGDEILFIFGEPLKNDQRTQFTDDEKDLSRKMMGYWANFAKFGDPNVYPTGGGLYEWPIHTPNGREYLNINSTLLRLADKSRATGRGPRVKQCAFWMEYLPLLYASTADMNEVEKEWKLQFHEWTTKYIVDWKVQYEKYVSNRVGGECRGTTTPPPTSVDHNPQGDGEL